MTVSSTLQTDCFTSLTANSASLSPPSRRCPLTPSSWTGVEDIFVSSSCRKPFLTRLTSEPLSIRHLASLTLPSVDLTWIQQTNWRCLPRRTALRTQAGYRRPEDRASRSQQRPSTAPTTLMGFSSCHSTPVLGFGSSWLPYCHSSSSFGCTSCTCPSSTHSSPASTAFTPFPRPRPPNDFPPPPFLPP